MFEKFVSCSRFDSYEDFYAHFVIHRPSDFNFAYDVVDEYARLEPNKTAIVWCNDAGDEAVFTFAELQARTNQTANFLRRQGIVKGDKVMLILKRRYEFWFFMLALHKLGAVAIPATHLLTKKDIVYRNNAADIKMIVAVADDSVCANVEAAEAESPSLKLKVIIQGERPGWIAYQQALLRESTVFERPAGKAAPQAEDMMLLYFTSGTTGMPKMVQHNFLYPLGHIVTAKYWQNVTPDGLHLTVSDTGWAKAVWGKIYGQWLAGSAVFVYDMDKFVPSRLLEVITRYRVTTFCAPPTVYRFFIKEDLSKYDFSALRWCTVAGEPLNPEVYHQWLQATGVRLMEGYGQTELTLTIGNFPWMEVKPGSMGKPAPGYDIELVDDEGRPCAVGDEGQIVVRTEKRKPFGMFGGYYRDEALTKSVWHDGVYYTGDVAWRDEDGYYWYVGRVDDVIKSSGYRIGPFEVESALLEHPAVLECAVTGVPDPERGQIVKASVVLARGWEPSDELARELQEHVKKTTAPYKYPQLVEFVPSLPKTISGKIRRVEIRSQTE
ncbi:MAG: AMP-binding protein [candidate division KSB1 bacterium]|nr:AMP-binding protein [candidate division KSB1 bacterium]